MKNSELSDSEAAAILDQVVASGEPTWFCPEWDAVEVANYTGWTTHVDDPICACGRTTPTSPGFKLLPP